MGANQEKAEPRSVNHGISVSVGLLGSCWLGVSWTKSRCFMKLDPFFGANCNDRLSAWLSSCPHRLLSLREQ